MLLNQRGMAQILVVLILLVGVVAGVYLVIEGPKIFKPKATEADNILFVDKSGSLITETKSTAVNIKIISPDWPNPTGGDAASVSGSTTVSTGQAHTYTATLSGTYITGEIHVAKDAGLSSFPCPAGIYKNLHNEYWCKIATGLAPSFTGSYTFTESGTYRVVVNGYKYDINTTPYDPYKACSGNPFGRYDSDPNKGWVSCGSTDDLTVTVTGSPVSTAPQASLSVSTVSVTPGQTVNLTATLGGTAQYGEIFVTKGDGKTEWNCPSETSRAGSWPNSQGEYWCLAKTSNTTPFTNTVTFSETGTYIAAVNAYGFPLGSTYDATKTCSGNPLGNYDPATRGWMDCGASDNVIVDVSGSGGTDRIIFTKLVILAEDPNFTVNKKEVEFTTEPINFVFSDSTPGTKTLYAKFVSTDNREQNTQPFPVQIKLIPASQNFDLDVGFIERIPRYHRYDVIYENNIPKLNYSTENQKRWPDIGEQLTYKAHILNKGSEISPAFSYQWLVDGQVVKSGSLASIEPGKEVVAEVQIAFPQNSQTIEFKVDPNNNLGESYQVNNSLKITSHDLTISYWVEKGLYDIFNKTKNSVGTYSFEDWIQAHFSKMNERFAQAVYSTAPQGIKNRVRIDKIVVTDEADGSENSARSLDPDKLLFDGMWQSTDGDPTNTEGPNGGWQNYVNTFVNGIDWGLIHEVTHQLGVIDLYRMNLKNDPFVNNGIQVKDLNGDIIALSNLPAEQVIFTQPGIMGGGSTTPHNDGTYFESHTAGGLNTHYSARRGFYGEYLWDTPATTSIKVVDASGNPIPNAQVNLYQKDQYSEDIDNVAEITGVTNDQGVVTLPNRSVPSASTVTGHSLKANPFGQINVVGTNGTMLVKVTKDNQQEGYGFLLLHDLNVEYWSGNKDFVTITVKTNYPKISLFSPKPTPTPTPISTPNITPQPSVSTTPQPLPTPEPCPEGLIGIFSTLVGNCPTQIPTPTPDTSIVPGSGDGNNDGKIDLIDLSIFFSNFLKTDDFNKAMDLNNDGVINSIDFSLMRNLLIEKGVIKR